MFPKKFNCNSRDDLSSLCYSPKLLESTFVEISKEKSDIIVGCIYKHPSLSLREFNSFLTPIFSKTNLENKTLILMGDFNIDLLKVEEDPQIASFLDLVSSNFLQPHITLPSRITPASKTLIDNIYMSMSNHKTISGNLISSFSDHLPQFLLLYSDYQTSKINTKQHCRGWKIFEAGFKEKLSSKNWDQVFDFNYVNSSFNSFNTFFDNNLNTFAPLKLMTKKQIKTKSKIL